ncbi:energy transducer TonB [Massilia sp. S19_KUP03_FR1]|uniref:energy transducer TonB n=1 Tax=Massilia sp. S19_KUP03_FR1 TaxID=3025503 RepID=UPI002FCD72BF
MHFAHAPHASGSKTTKLAVVVVFHLILGIGLVKTMNTKLLSMPTETADIQLVPNIDPPVVTPPTANLPDPPPLPAPRIVVPVVELPVTTPPLTNTVTTTTTTSEPLPPTQPPGPAITPTTHAGTGVAAVRTAAMLDGCTKPAYPAQAARNGDSGTVTLALLVGVDGRVTGSRVERSSGFRDLDRAALSALSQCRFKPAMLGDVAQAGWTQLAYVWSLE